MTRVERLRVSSPFIVPYPPGCPALTTLNSRYLTQTGAGAPDAFLLTLLQASTTLGNRYSALVPRDDAFRATDEAAGI
jgi:hypothetical protein